MAGPVRPAYRSREAGEGGHRCPRTPTPTTPIAAGGSFCTGRRRVIVPPAAACQRRRRSPDRRPGSGVAGARGRDRLPGRRLRRTDRGRWRPRRQHQPDRLPGGLHRPLVRGPGRGHDLPAHRQLRPARRRRPVRSGRGCGRWSWPMRRPRSSMTPASWPRSCATTRSRPSPAWTRAPSRGTSARTAACAGIVTAPGEIGPRGAVARPPGPSRAGRTRTSSARSRRRRSPDIEAAGDSGPRIGIVDLGLKSNIVRAMRHRGARVRVFPHTADAVRRPRRPTSMASSSRPGPATRRGWSRRSRWPARSSMTAGRCSGSASATRSSARAAGADTTRLRFGHHGANHPVQDLELGLVQVTAQNHEVQVVGDSLPAASGLPRSAR